MREKEYRWLELAKELQALAQIGLTYSEGLYDKERYMRIREIAAEMMSENCGMPIDEVKDLFCGETGYQTPKLDTRAAIFQHGKILLVKEHDGRWTLPGGWVDQNETIKENTIKEVKEEAGLDIVPLKLIAMHDRNLHNNPPYAYNICKAFVLCSLIGGEFRENSETASSRYFDLNDVAMLPLAEEKTTYEQIKMCFCAQQEKDWVVEFD